MSFRASAPKIILRLILSRSQRTFYSFYVFLLLSDFEFKANESKLDHLSSKHLLKASTVDLLKLFPISYLARTNRLRNSQINLR